MSHPNVITPKIKPHNIVARKLVENIVLLKSNKHYRFGDVIFKKGYYWKKSRDYIIDNDEFKNSILQTYLNSISDKSWKTDESINMVSENLNNIIKNYILKEPTIQLPLPNELVIQNVHFVPHFIMETTLKKIFGYIMKKYTI